MKTRQQILDNAKRQIREIDQYFVDVAYWNRVHPQEDQIDPDPTGSMASLRAALAEMLRIDEAKGHTGTIDAPSLDILIKKEHPRVQ